MMCRKNVKESTGKRAEDPRSHIRGRACWPDNGNWLTSQHQGKRHSTCLNLKGISSDDSCDLAYCEKVERAAHSSHNFNDDGGGVVSPGRVSRLGE